jgi:NADH-quinone oxidoreductase subunit L
VNGESLLHVVCLALLTAPAAVVLGLSLGWLLGYQPPERTLVRVTRSVDLLMVLLAVALAGIDLTGAVAWPAHLNLGNWYQVGDLSFPVTLYIDNLSVTMVLMTTLLVLLARSFSVRYLHRDPGFFRFFLLLHLYVLGCLTIFLAGSLNLLLAGWELVGITSVLLIAFFQYRPEPPRNALRVFATYRLADIGLLLSVAFSIHFLGSSSWETLLDVASMQGTAAWLPPTLGCLLIISASGKSSQGATAGWLPRAMEGPTPSTAIFYGAISVHAGAFLLIRAEPLLEGSPVARGLLFFIGASTALMATLSHRTSNDAKTSIAYASMCQVGIIFAEVALGLTTLALLHIVGHAALRTAQFLRAPSMLHDHHEIHAAAGGATPAPEPVWTSALPPGVRDALYTIGLQRGYSDALLEHVLVEPVRSLSRLLWRTSRWLTPAGGGRSDDRGVP